MTSKLGALAVLVLAAMPLAATDLLRTEMLLSLEDRAHAGDRFGTSVALSSDGKTMVVGAAQAETKGTGSGAVHVFRLEKGSWNRDPSFPETARETAAFDAYGYCVAVNGDGRVIAVGAPLHDDPKGNTGAVYIWSQSPQGSWSSIELRDSNADQNDQLGTSVALSNDGKTLAAGAPQPNPVPDPTSGPGGKAVVFTDQGSARWAQSLLPMGEQHAFAFIGFDVAINKAGNAVVVGAPGTEKQQANSQSPLFQAGAVYLFTLKEDGWARNLLAQGTVQGDELGISVAISDDGTVVAGAREKGANQSRKGSVYIFQPQAQVTVLSLTKNTLQFGASVAVSGSGDTVVVGAPGSSDPKVNEPNGEAHFFQRTGTVWTNDPKSASLSSCNGQEAPSFGQSVALSETSGVVGIPLEEAGGLQGAGSVCVLDLAGIEVSTPDFPGRVTPGRQVAFDITVTNQSGQSGSGTLRVMFDAGKLFNVELKCKEGCSSAETSAAGSGEVSAQVTNLAAGASVVFRFTASVKPDAVGDLGITIEFNASSGSLDVTSVTPSTPPTLVPEAGLAIRKEVKCITDDKQCLADGPRTTVDCSRTTRGKCLQYTITVTNRGPSQPGQTMVTDSFNSDAITAVKWSCKERQGARCGKKAGSGNISDAKVFLPVNGELVYTAVAQTSTTTKVRDLGNTASVKSKDDKLTGNNNSRVVTILPRADLKIESFSPDASAIPGESLQLKVVVLNLGEDPVENALVEGTVAGVAFTWSCGGQNNANHVSLSKDEKVTCTANVAIRPEVRGTIESTVNVTAPSDVPDFETENNHARRTTTLKPKSELNVSTMGPDRAIPGDELPFTYSLKITNQSGPSDLIGGGISAAFPVPFTAVTWVCDPQAACRPASGHGNLESQIDLPVGSSVTVTVRARIEPSAVGSAKTTIHIRPETESLSQPISVDVTIPLTPVTDLAMVRHQGPTTPVIPGNPLPSTWIVEVTNAGPSDAQIARVTEDFSPDLTTVTWSCAATKASCAPSGHGEIRENVSLQAGGSLTFTVKGVAGPELTSTTGVLSALARVIRIQGGAVDPRTDNNDLRAPVPLTPVADLAITKIYDNVTAPANPVYRITVVNAGPSDVVGAVVRDQPPAPGSLEAATPWVCAALNGSCECLPPDGCKPHAANGAGCLGGGSALILEDKISLRVGGSIVYTLPAGAVMGNSNIGCVTAPPLVQDPRGDNNVSEVKP